MKGANNSSKDRNSSNKPPTSGNNPSSKKQRGKRKKGPKKLDETAQGIPKNSTDTKESSVKNSNDSNNNATLPNGNTATRSNSNEIGVSNSCNAHPNKSLLSPTETLSLLHSKTFFKNFSEEASASSMLCNDCSVKVACCFNVMQDTLQNFMAEMLGLRKTAKCVECVQQHLQQTLTNGRQHVEHVPVVCKVEQDEQNETPKTEQTTAIKQEVTECPFVNKDVKSEDEKDEAFRPSNIGGNAISPADHNRCDPAQCHIRRWYCSTPPASVSPIKKPITKPIKSEKDSPNPLVNSPQMQITSPLESLTSVHNIENEISQTSVNNVKQEMSSASTGSPTTDKVKSEAYVTLATNDLHAIGCLILGHSIRLTGTARSLAVVVSNRVSPSIRELLESVFDAIYSISDHELKLVGDPELGVSYNKIHVWKLTKFSKCVFLDCDMFVVKNCDELFERTEFSAVPDIGWPDCFNSGVFVYVPSDTTFKQLLKTAQLPTIVDGGEQGLLNIYFGETWKSSINCRLPFIYNLMANVSYTYIPAFKQFGNSAKIVHFLGSMKPWNIEWSPISGKMTPNVLTSIHESYYVFIQNWITIFIHYVIPCFSLQLQDMAKKFSSMTVRNLMKMYQHFVGEQSDHLPSNPSMRVRYTDTQQHLKLSLDQFKWDINVEETAEEIFEDEKYTAGLSSEMDESIDKDMQRTGESSDLDVKSEVEVIETEDEKDKENIEENISETEVDSTLPDYNRMYLWEKGQMDYAGSDSSNNIMKKLDSLINRAKIN